MAVLSKKDENQKHMPKMEEGNISLPDTQDSMSNSKGLSSAQNSSHTL